MLKLANPLLVEYVDGKTNDKYLIKCTYLGRQGTYWNQGIRYSFINSTCYDDPVMGALW